MDETSDSATSIHDEEEEEEEEEEEGSIHDDEVGYEEDTLRVRRYNHNRRMKLWYERTKDRISDLPDAIITHILSLMSATDVVRTGALSKRWRHVWASTPVLEFSCRGRNPYQGFVEFVDKFMILHRGPKIKKFTLHEISFKSDLEPSFNLWVHAAVIKQVEELTLGLEGHCVGGYSLPHFLLSCSSLTKLSLSVCKFSPTSSVQWKSLKSLTLSFTKGLTDDVIQRILNGSPVLECLELIDCVGFHCIDVSSGSLRRLVVNGYGSGGDDISEWIEISGPNLWSLDILGYMQGKLCRVKNIPSLVQVSLRFSMSLEDDYDSDDEESVEAYETLFRKYQIMLIAILQKVRHVEKLAIGTWCIQVLSICELRNLPCTVLSRCKCLVMNTPLLVWDLPGIAKLLRSSPLLERFIIDLWGPYEFEEVLRFMEFSSNECSTYWKSQEKSESLLSNLKIVELIGIGYCDNVINIAQFLLQQAKVLEKMVFTPGQDSDEYQQGWMDFSQSDFIKLSKKLLSFQRASANAKIVLL